jgi:hypothetical protein
MWNFMKITIEELLGRIVAATFQKTAAVGIRCAEHSKVFSP